MHSTARQLLVLLCFFVSGIAGLTYQVVWSRYLALFVGSTGAAHVIILSTFMGGLALGSHLFGARADRVRSPLMLYVGLEAGIGVFGLLYPSLFGPVRGLFTGIAGVLGLGPVSLNIAAMVSAALTVLVPTTLMGGTLPALARYLVHNEANIGRRISVLYYLNSFGAVFGALLAGFWLIQSFGLELTSYFAAAMNFAAAGLAFILAKKAEGLDPLGDQPAPPTPMPEPELRPATANRGLTMAQIALVVIGISGFISFVYEVAWIRLLTLVLGSSSNSFSLMLAAFIFGITLGSFLLSLKKTDRHYYRILGWCEIMIGLTSLLAILGFERLPVVLNHLRTSLVNEGHAYPLYLFMQFTLSFVVMVVPTIFMGATLPAASRVVSEGIKSLGQKVGDVYAINTIGTLGGAIIAGFVLLPTIGIKHTIELAVAANIGLGLWVLFTDRDANRSVVFKPQVAAALAGAVAFLYVARAPEWDTRVFTAATYRSKVRIESFESFSRQIAERDILYYRDGTEATIAVSEDDDPEQGRVRALLINGKPDASSGYDMITQLMIAHLPLMIHKNAQDVLVVGLGSGVTAGHATLYNPGRVDCVELIPEVVKASDYFREWNLDVRANPSVNIIIQDAKTYLQVSPQQYDVIINEPTNPWISGVAGLFTQEYFAMCQERLREDGIFVQWVQCYELTDATFFTILKTFNEAFPYSTIFNVASTDTILVGSRTPFSPDFARMEAVFQNPAIAAELARYEIRGVLPILSMQMGAKTTSPAPWFPVEVVYSDFYPALEYEAAKGFFIGQNATGAKALDRRSHSPRHGQLWIHDYVPSAPPSNEEMASWFNMIRRFGSIYDRAEDAWCALWERYHPDSRELAMARVLSRRERRDPQLFAAPQLEGSVQAAWIQFNEEWDEYRLGRNFARVPDGTALRRAATAVQQLAPERSIDPLLAIAEVESDLGNGAAALEALGTALKESSMGRRSRHGDSIARRTAEELILAGRREEAARVLASVNPGSLSGEELLRFYLAQARALGIPDRKALTRDRSLGTDN